MRRIELAIGLILLPALALLLFIWHTQPTGLPQQAANTLAHFRQRAGLDVGDGWRVVSSTQATRAGVLAPAISLTTYGDSVYFRTDGDSPPPVNSKPGVQHAGADNLRPVPYPPRQLWCVTLRHEERGNRALLVALYEDLYNAGWLVHTVAQQAEQSILIRVGCTGSG